MHALSSLALLYVLGGVALTYPLVLFAVMCIKAELWFFLTVGYIFFPAGWLVGVWLMFFG